MLLNSTMSSQCRLRFCHLLECLLEIRLQFRKAVYVFRLLAIIRYGLLQSRNPSCRGILNPPTYHFPRQGRARNEPVKSVPNVKRVMCNMAYKVAYLRSRLSMSLQDFGVSPGELSFCHNGTMQFMRLASAPSMVFMRSNHDSISSNIRSLEAC